MSCHQQVCVNESSTDFISNALGLGNKTFVVTESQNQGMTSIAMKSLALFGNQLSSFRNTTFSQSYYTCICIYKYFPNTFPKCIYNIACIYKYLKAAQLIVYKTPDNSQVF